jgi:hypothetical protein
VLNDDTSFLAEAQPEPFGAAILQAINAPDLAADKGRRAREMAESKYSDEAFIAKTRIACGLLAGEERAEVAGGVA